MHLYVIYFWCIFHKTMSMWDNKSCQFLYFSSYFEVYEHPSRPNNQGVVVKAWGLVEYCTKLATSASCTFIKLIMYKLHWHGTIAMASPLQQWTIYSIKVNWTFQPSYTSLLTKKKLTCNLGIWNAYLVQMLYVLPITTTSMMMDFISIALRILILLICTLHKRLLHTCQMCPIQNHMLEGSWIYIIHLYMLFECSHYTLQLCSLIDLCILPFFRLIVLWFITKRHVWSFLLH